MGLQQSFRSFASIGDGSEMTLVDLEKWCSDAGITGTHMSTNLLNSVFNRVKAVGTDTLTFSEVDAMVIELASEYQDGNLQLYQKIPKLKQMLEQASVMTKHQSSNEQDPDIDKPVTKRIRFNSNWVKFENIPTDVVVLEIIGWVHHFGFISSYERSALGRWVVVGFEDVDAAQTCLTYYKNGLLSHGNVVTCKKPDGFTSAFDKLVDDAEPKTEEFKASDGKDCGKVLEVSNFRRSKTTTTGLFNLFSLYGTVNKILMHKETDQAFVVFGEEKDAANAQKMLNGVQIWGLNICLKIRTTANMDIFNDTDLEMKDFVSGRDSLCVFAPSDVLLVEDLPEAMDEANISKMFDIRATVLKCRITSSLGNKKTAHVQLLTISEATESIMILHERPFVKTSQFMAISFVDQF